MQGCSAARVEHLCELEPQKERLHVADTADPDTYRTQRSAAVRNRNVILDVAHRLLASDPDVSMNEIAKQAGVGAGTLYRNFPKREALILAVYRHDVDVLIQSVDQHLANERNARDALIAWFNELAGYIRIKHGLGEALRTQEIQSSIATTYAPVLEAVTKLVDACIREGFASTETKPEDVLLLMGFLWRIDSSESAQTTRITDIVFRGIAP